MLKRASVNGFGFGGTNAHAVVESARHYLGDIAKESLKNCDVKLGKRRIYVLSAHKKESAQTQRARLVKYLNARHGGTDSTMMEDLAYTLSERRSRLAWNLAIQASSIQELTECLGSDRYQAMKQTVKPNLAFIFTGQGAQWARMGMELMIYPQFQQVIKEASELLQEIGAKWSLLGEHRLFTNETKAYRSILEELSQNTPETRVNESIVSQPACTAIQLGLLELLASWNIKPQVAIGHSSGEIAAAYAAGAFDRDVAISIAYYRGTLAEKAAQVHHGSMLAIGAGREIVDPFLQNLKMGKVVIACENSPESVTASGDVEAILELQVLMNERGLFNRKLATSCAYHSPHMACIADDYRKKLADLPKSRKSGDGIRFYSSLHGGSYPVASLNADYWVENLVCPVKFFDAMSALLSDSLAAGGEEAVNTLLEIGPHPALQQPTKTIIQSVTKADKFTYLPTLLRGKDDVFNMLEVARRMFMEGLPVELREVNQASANTSRMILTDLPPYPWTHVDRYWIETRYTQNSRFSQFPRNDVLGTVNLDSIGLEPTWRNTISVNDLPWLKPLSATTFEYPISGYVSMAVEAVYQLAIQTNVEFDDIRLQNMEIVEPLELPAGTTFETQITLRPAHVKDASGAPDIRKWHAFEIFSWTNEEGWRHHCRGLAIVCESSWKNPIDGDLQKKAAERNWMSTCRNIEVACNEEIDGVQFYRSLEQGLGAELSECLKGVQRIHMSHLESLVEVLLPNSAMAVPFQFENPIVLHPTLIEPCLQSISPALINGELNTTTVLRHQSIGNLRLSMDMTREPGTQFGVYSRLEKGAADKLSTSAFYLDKSHSSHIPGLEIDELVSTWESLNTTETDLKPRSLCYKTLWKPHPRFISPLYFQDRKGVMGQNSFHNFNGSRECNGDTSTNVAVLPPFPDDTSLPIAVASTISYIELLVHAKISRCSIIGTGEAFAAMCLRLLPILHGRVESVELGGISANAFSIISKRLSGLHVSCQISYKAFGETDSKGDDNTKNVDIAVITPSLRLSNQLEYSMDRVQTLLKEDGHLIIMRPNSTEAHPTDLPEPDVSEQLNGPANLRNGDVISFDEVQGMRLVSASNYCSDKAWDIKIFEKSPTPARDVSIKVITVDEVYPRESSSAPCRLDQIEPEDMVGQTCILLAMRSPLLQIPSSKIFKNLQGLASYCSTILWVIQGGYQDSTSPDTYMAAGLCRTLRWENPSLRCALLDLDGKHEELDNNALKVIKNVLQEVLTSDSELEFMERDGNVFVPRVVVDNTLNRYLYPESPLGPVLRLSLAESKNPLKMLHGSSLPGNEVIFVEDDIDGLPLDDDWVQIEVKSFPVASMDSITMQTHNSHELRCISSGVITKVGHNVESLGIGNRVYAVTTGEFSSVVRSPAKLVSCISDDMDFSEVTSLLNTFTLVFYAMANANGLPREGSVLVHNASSRLGQAALKLLESTSTKVLATVNSVAGKVLIMNTYGVPEEHIFSREESSYPSGVLRATQGKGVDVVIDASRGDRVGDWEPCLNRSGRFVQLHQVQSRSQLPRLVKNQQFRSVDFITALVDQPDTVMSIASMILKQWSEGNLKPVRPLQKLSLSEYDQSLLLAQNANLVGDITIEVTRQEKVQVSYF
jgi:malonyl CoA-acyl carrier protein transacylase